MRRAPRIAGWAVCVLIVTITLVAVSHGGPPGSGGGGSTSPVGTIYFVAGDTIRTMKADGSGKQEVSPVLTTDWAQAVLSARSYDGSHWHLRMGPTDRTIMFYDDNHDGTYTYRSSTSGCELFAYRWKNGSWQVLQVTDFNRDGLRDVFYSSGEAPVAWSNDGSDTFISIRQSGWNLTPGGGHIASATRPRYIIRLEISGSSLDEFADAGQHPMLRAADPRCAVVAMQAADKASDATFTMHSWSPDGTSLIYSETPDPADVYYWTNVYGLAVNTLDPMVDTTTDVLLYAAGDQYFTYGSWSPDGSRIAISDGGDVYLITPAGTGLTHLLSSQRAYHSHVYWSPDSKWLVYRKLTSTRQIVKLPATGGKEVILTKDLGGIQQWTLGWSAG